MPPRPGRGHYIPLYVVDLLFASSAQVEVHRVKAALHDKFGMKCLGEAKLILELQVRRCLTSRISYLRVVFARLDMTESRTKTPQ